MDKGKEILNTAHSIQINERKTIFLTGIKKIESFDSNEFFIESIMGYILVKGEGLELLKLDTFQGNLSIKGRVDSINYMEDANKKNKSEGLLTKLFK